MTTTTMKRYGRLLAAKSYNSLPFSKSTPTIQIKLELVILALPSITGYG